MKLALLTLILSLLVLDSAQGISLDSATPPESLTQLSSWLMTHTSANPPLPPMTELAHFPGMGVGVKATTHISQGEPYLAIPLSSAVSLATIEATPGLGSSILIPVLYPALSSSLPPGFMPSSSPSQLQTDLAFVLWLSAVRFGPSSLRTRLGRGEMDWNDYVDALPDEFGTPLYFSPDALAALAGSDLARDARDDRTRVVATAAWLRDVLGSHLPRSVLTDDAIIWAWSVVASRRINVAGAPLDRSKHAGHLIPYIDMINARESSDRSFTSYSSQWDAIVMYADEDYAPGHQVFETYGNKTNTGYLRYNGFVYVDNPNDCVNLVFDLSSVAPHALSPVFHPLYRRLRIRLSGPSTFARCVGSRLNAASDLIALGLLHALTQSRGGSPQSVLDILPDPVSLSALLAAATPDEKKAAYHTIRTPLRTKLASYPTKAKQDRARLADPSLPEDVRAAVSFVLEEKKPFLRLIRRLKALLAPPQTQHDDHHHPHTDL